jgi:hypothetical protein
MTIKERLGANIVAIRLVSPLTITAVVYDALYSGVCK